MTACLPDMTSVRPFPRHRDPAQAPRTPSRRPSTRRRRPVLRGRAEPAVGPEWLTSIQALPMYLGLDLRGGVHFLPGRHAGRRHQAPDATTGDLRTLLRDGCPPRRHHPAVKACRGDPFRDTEAQARARVIPPPATTRSSSKARTAPITSPPLSPLRPRRPSRNSPSSQNISTLHNRINELGVAEPVIQQQGADRIVVQAARRAGRGQGQGHPGRTAPWKSAWWTKTRARRSARRGAPLGTELYNGAAARCWSRSRSSSRRPPHRRPARLRRPDQRTRRNTSRSIPPAPASSATSPARTSKRWPSCSSKGQGEVVTAPVIRSEIGGGRADLRSHEHRRSPPTPCCCAPVRLAAPDGIIEERTIGPSLGAENINKGFHSTLWGFVAIAIFMCGYYLLFGLVSVIALPPTCCCWWPCCRCCRPR